MNKAGREALKEWMRVWAKENFSEETLRLIDQANFDLYHGGCSEEEYPGFTTACRLIKKALENVPELFIELGSDCVLDYEPEKFSDAENDCYSCWVAIEKKEIRRAIVGAELSQYLF